MTLLIIAAVLVGIPLLAVAAWYTCQHPKVWLGLVLLIFPAFLADSGVGYSWSEFVSGGFIIGTVVIWTLYKLSTGYTLVRGWPDVFIVVFIVLSVGNLVPALANGAEVDEWLVEWSLFLILLYYFPIREYFGKSTTDLNHLLILCCIAVLIMAAYTGYEWLDRSNNKLVYAYQLIASRSRLFAPVFSLAAAIAIASYFNVATFRVRLLLLAFIIVNILGLVQSVTRSLWLMFAVSLVITMFFLRFRQNINLVAICVVLATVTYVTLSVKYPRITRLAVKMVTQRMETGKITGGDRSLETRVNEVKVIWKDIQRYPLSGVGISIEYVAWDPIVQLSGKKAYVHMGYMGALFRLGFGLTLLIMAMLIAFSLRTMITTLALFRKRADSPKSIVRGVSIGLFAFQPTLFAFISVSGFLDQRWGNAIMAVSFALISIVHQLSNAPQSEGTHLGEPMPVLLGRAL